MKSKSRLQNTAYNLITGFAGEFVIYLVQIVVRTVFIQTLGRSYLGIGGLFTNILTMLSLADLGIGNALNYRLYEPLKNNNTERLKAIMSFYKRVYRIIALVMLCLGLCVIPFLKYLIKDYDTFAKLGLSAGVVFSIYLLQSVSTYCFFAYKSAIVKSNQKEYLINIATYFGTILNGICEVVVLLVTKNFYFYLIVTISINLLQSYVNAQIANKMFPFLSEPLNNRISKAEQKEIFKDCFSISLFSMSSVVLKATDNIVLAAYIGLDVVGLYSNYLIFYNALKKIVKKVIRSAQASIGNMFADATYEKRYDCFKVVQLIMAIFTGTAAVGVAIMSDEVIQTWIGTEYVIASPFSILIGIELYTIGVKLVLEQMRDTLGFFQKLKWRPIVETILNIVISVTLVQKIGIYGVIIGTIVSELLTVTVIDPSVVYRYGFGGKYRVGEYYFTNFLFVVELVVAFLFNQWVVKNVLSGYGWFSVIAHTVICGCSTLVILCVCNCRRKEFEFVKKRFMQIGNVVLRRKKK